MNNLHNKNTKKGIGWLGEVFGEAPVQGIGEYFGSTWYFKARGSKWTFEINGKKPFKKSEPWGTWPDAGYMSHEEAWAIITGIIETLIDEQKK